MSRVSPRRRTTIQAVLLVLAGCTAALAVLAALWPQWIETLGADPDQGSGSLEWLIPIALAGTAILLAVAYRLSRRVWYAAEQTG
jgi:hypothetical protein